MEEDKNLDNNEYLQDDPIESPTNDCLERSYFAYHLAKSIHNLKTINNSYTIGILGKWGSGKTSTIKMALKYLKELYNNSNARLGDLDKIIKEEENFSKSELQIKFPKIFTKRLLLFYCICIIFCFLTYPIINTILNTITFKLLEFISITDYCAYVIYGIIISAIKECCLFYFYGLIFFEFYKKYSIINNNNYIEIWFEPWNYTNKELILKNFFDILMKNLSNDNDNKCIENLNKLFIEYTKIIGNIDISPFFNIQTNKDLLDIKTKIKNCLKESSKQIIIVIDDLDRLFPDELLLIFQVIKMLVDFPNIIYILSFDKEIVTNILKEKFPTNTDDYLKKIIQIEKNLPIIDDTILRKYFIKGIEEIVGNNIDDEQKTDILEFYDYAYKDIYIKNMRDIKMFFNHFMFVYSSLKDENLYLLDIISISMIETFENNLYEYIIYNKDLLCSSSGNCNDKTIYIYNKKKKIIFNQKLEQLIKFKNIKILQIIFPYLFKQIYTLIKNNQNQNSLLSDNSIKYLYENLDEDILNKNFEIEKYRRLANPISFENYFRMDIKTTNINASEIDSLINNIYSPDNFNQILFDLYSQKSDKIVDFITYWDSNYNNKYKDKNHTIQLLVNLLSLSNEQIELIHFLDKNDIFFDISRNLIRVYNDKNSLNLITLDDFYNKIFLKTISFLNNNLYFFIYLIFCQYKFPIDNPPKLESLDPNNTFDKICTYLKNNIDKNNILKNKNAMSILFYLYKYLNLQENVLTWINELLSENNPDKLLHIIITSKNLRSNYLDKYGSTIDFFKNINKETELKSKLLEIFFSDDYKTIKQNKNFIINDDYDINMCIVEHILNLYYSNKLKQLIHNIRSSQPLPINEQLIRLENELRRYKNNELKYIIYVDKNEANIIKNFLQNNKKDIIAKNSKVLNAFLKISNI